MAPSAETVLLTGASMGIGEAIAKALLVKGYNLVLVSRSEDKLAKLAGELSSSRPDRKVIWRAVDIGVNSDVDKAIDSVVSEIGPISILINNAGLALGAPSSFPDLCVSDFQTMVNTNINGLMYVTYAVLNKSMRKSGNGTILNITSVTGLEVPPFPGEAIYHASKAFQEAFTNALRNELNGTNIRVLALRPGCVATNFHSQRVGHDKKQYDEFFSGFNPLVPEDIAGAATYMLEQPQGVSVKAMDIVPSAQRSLTVFDRKWTERNA